MMTGAMRKTPKKVLEMLLDLPQLGTVVEPAALAAAYRLPRPNRRTLKMGHNLIWMKAEKVDSRFIMSKDNIVPGYIRGTGQ